MNKPRIAITMGEPGGIGPEIIVKALCSPDLRKLCAPLVVGNAEIMRNAVKLVGLPLSVKPVSGVEESVDDPNVVEVLDVRSRIPKLTGKPGKSAGVAVVKYIKKAVDLALGKKVSAVVTAPISKESLSLAGYSWPGHTELLAELTHSRNFAMMFTSERLNIILCTIHTALKKVPSKITKGVVYRTICHAGTAMAMLGNDNPRIAVAGLNPHGGESGIMGTEEMNAIIPAVEQARKEGRDVSGPYPPDVVFHRALNNEFNIVVCMYHDQGLIPFKMIAFETGVNVTVGLPIIRTSPDHGTAFDIAWKNMANPSSMKEAIKCAVRMKL